MCKSSRKDINFHLKMKCITPVIVYLWTNRPSRFHFFCPSLLTIVKERNEKCFEILNAYVVIKYRAEAI